MNRSKLKHFPTLTRAILMTGACMISTATLLSTTLPASAAIKCDGQFQIIKGQGSIATPWCEDNYLAIVARTYGWKVSNRTVRNNPGVKARICRHIGHDGRVRMICSGHVEGGHFDRRSR